MAGLGWVKVKGPNILHYVMVLILSQEMLKNSEVNITRIAYGVPFGGELEYADMRTLSHAFSSRSSI